VVKEFRRLKSDPVPQEELRRAKDQLKGSLMLSLESSAARMSNLARQEMYFKRFFTLDEMIQSIEDVTAEQVQLIAREFFDPQNITLAMLGNLGDFKVKREDFVPPIYRLLAFADLEIPLGDGEKMWAPKMEARVLQELAVKRSDRVLEVGTGSGYLTALFAHRAALEACAALGGRRHRRVRPQRCALSRRQHRPDRRSER
jgi:hypothetical protein